MGDWAVWTRFDEEGRPVEGLIFHSEEEATQYADLTGGVLDHLIPQRKKFVMDHMSKKFS